MTDRDAGVWVGACEASIAESLARLAGEGIPNASTGFPGAPVGADEGFD